MSPHRTKKSKKQARRVLRCSGTLSPQASRKTHRKPGSSIVHLSQVESFWGGYGKNWKAIFDNAQDGILIADIATGRLIRCNKMIAKMLGYSEAEILSLSIKGLHPAKEMKRALAEFDRLAKGQVSVVTDIPMKRKNGSIFYVDISCSRLEFSGRKYLVGFFRDVSERRGSEKALIESEEMFRTFTERSPNMIFINQGGRVVYANPMCEKIMGYTSKEFYSPRFNFLALMHRKDISAIRRNFLDHQKGKEVAPYEYKMVTKGGKLIYGILTSKLIQYRGAPAILGIVTDISDRKKAEEALRESENRFRKSVENSPMAMAIVSTKGVIEFINQKAIKVFGYLPKDIPTMEKWWVRAYPGRDYRKEVVADWTERVQRGIASNSEIKGSEYRVTCKDRTLRTMFISGAYIAGKIVVLFDDITERRKAEEALRESEEKYRRLIETTGTGYVTLDECGRVIDANREYVRLTGRKRLNEIVGHRVREWTAPYDRERNVHEVKKCLNRGFVRNFEVDYLTPAGRIIPIEINATVVRDGAPTRILTLCRDITERKQAEASLAQREAHLSAIIENQPGMVWLKDADSRFLAVNQKFAHAAGIKNPKNIIGKTDRDIWPRELAKKYQADDKRVMKTRKPITVEEPILGEGVRKWYETFKTPIIEEGRVIGTSGYARDITERKEAEAALRLAHFSIDHAAASIFRIDPQARFLYVNDAACQTLGYSRKELLSMTVHDIDPYFQASVWPAHWNELRRKKHMSFEGTHKTKNGRIFPVEVHINFLKFEGREYNIAFVRDISERKRAEEELKKTLSLERATLESTADGILVVESNAKKVTDFNDRFSQLWNIPKKILESRDDKKLLKHVVSQLKDPGRFLSKVAELYKHPRKESFDVLEFKDGRIFERYSHPQFVDGKPMGRVWSFRDVTERKKSETLLRKSAKEWRTTFDAVGDAVWLLSLDGRILQTNKTASRMFGKDGAKILGRSCCEVVHGSKAPPPGCPLRRMRKSLHRESWETSFLNRWFRVTVDPVLDERGSLSGVVHIVSDITNRKRADEAVLKVTRFNESVIGSLPGIFYVFNKQGKFLRVNKEFLRVTQYSLNQLIGKMTPLDFFDQEDKIKVKDRIGEVFTKGEASVEAGLISKDGKKTPYFFTGIRTVIDGIPLVVGVGIDIAERKRAEDFLREHRHQLLQVIDTVPHMIFAEDGKGRFLLVNQAVAQAYGKEPKGLIGTLRQDVHKVREEIENYLRDDKEILASDKPRFIPEEFFTDIHGRRHVLRTAKIPFRMVGAKEKCILGVSVDVTEQRKIEDFRNDIIRTVSHELRTPLSIEKEGISLLIDEMVGPVSTQQKEILETVMRSIDRLARMISSLLDVSSIETGKIKLFQKITDLGPIVKDVIFEFKKRAGEKSIDLGMKPAERAVQVLMDPDKIMQVLSNLVDNAIKFTPEGGTVRISLIVFKNEVECEVRDTGIGIAPENIAKAFEKFQQFSRKDGPGEKGFGLGLSIAKGIVELHGGRIWIEGELGKGTRATFSLPLYQGEKDRGHA